MIKIPFSPSIISSSFFLSFFNTFFTPTIVGIDNDLATMAKCPSGPPKPLTRPTYLFFDSEKRSAGPSSLATGSD